MLEQESVLCTSCTVHLQTVTSYQLTITKRLTRKVTPSEDFIKVDGYDSDTESKYDRPFNAHKLGLDVPTATTHKLNKRVAENIETLKNLAAEHAEKKSLTVNAPKVSGE